MIPILLKMLAALVPMPQQINGSVVGADAYLLKQKIEILLSSDPVGAEQINTALWRAVFSDWPATEQMGIAVAQALTQGKQELMPRAVSTLQQFAQRSLIG